LRHRNFDSKRSGFTRHGGARRRIATELFTLSGANLRLRLIGGLRLLWRLRTSGRIVAAMADRLIVIAGLMLIERRSRRPGGVTRFGGRTIGGRCLTTIRHWLTFVRRRLAVVRRGLFVVRQGLAVVGRRIIVWRGVLDRGLSWRIHSFVGGLIIQLAVELRIGPAGSGRGGCRILGGHGHWLRKPCRRSA